MIKPCQIIKKDQTDTFINFFSPSRYNRFFFYNRHSNVYLRERILIDTNRNLSHLNYNENEVIIDQTAKNTSPEKENSPLKLFSKRKQHKKSIENQRSERKLFL